MRIFGLCNHTPLSDWLVGQLRLVRSDLYGLCWVHGLLLGPLFLLFCGGMVMVCVCHSVCSLVFLSELFSVMGGGQVQFTNQSSDHLPNQPKRSPTKPKHAPTRPTKVMLTYRKGFSSPTCVGPTLALTVPFLQQQHLPYLSYNTPHGFRFLPCGVAVENLYTDIIFPAGALILPPGPATARTTVVLYAFAAEEHNCY